MPRGTPLSAIAAFEHLFRERGLPGAIRSDNGVPFASPNALFNLSRLAVWWLRLGIGIERMQLTLKKETTRPPGRNTLQWQAQFDAYLQEFNTEHPHEARDMQRPADRYQPSSRPCQGLPELI